MENNHESDDAVHAADAILKEAQRGKNEYTLDLEYSAVRNLWSLLRFYRLIPTLFRDVSPEAAAKLHPESMLTVVNKKVRMALTTDPLTGTKIKKDDPKPPIVPLVLTTRQMDFLNALIFENAKPTKDPEDDMRIVEILYPEGITEERAASRREESLSTRMIAMARLIDLNLAFIRAGGPPRPEFTAFYEGPLPPAAQLPQK